MYISMNYNEDLSRRQEEHLRRVNEYLNRGRFVPKLNYSQPCAHDNCSECVGTGIRRDGTSCVHILVCSCPKCRRFTL